MYTQYEMSCASGSSDGGSSFPSRVGSLPFAFASHAHDTYSALHTTVTGLKILASYSRTPASFKSKRYPETHLCLKSRHRKVPLGNKSQTLNVEASSSTLWQGQHTALHVLFGKTGALPIDLHVLSQYPVAGVRRKTESTASQQSRTKI